jgi:peptidoglycan hydrolase-like protein with peptidoglycan-binding domain
MTKYAATNLPGGWAKIIQIAEDLRERDTDGYLGGAGHLAKIKGYEQTITKAITCSPFTGNVIGLAFDPSYPRKDLDGDPYVPLFNGGNDPLPFNAFYKQHNDKDRPVESLVDYNLGEEISPKKMKRGDQVGIDWFSYHKDKKTGEMVWGPGGGHSVFCWDVHLNKAGEVDAFQMLGAHGGSGNIGYGVHIYGCHGTQWLTGKPNNGKLGTGTLEKAKPKIFVDEDDIVKYGVWFTLPGVGEKDLDLDTFRVKPKNIAYANQKSPWYISVHQIKAGRFHYEGEEPKPYCMKDGSAKAAPSDPPGHFDATVTTVKGNDIKKDPGAVKKVEPKPAQQDSKKPLNWQHDVEQAMQILFRAKWIDSDPGKSDNINDSQTQAAIKEFQKKFKLMVDGIVGPQTRGAIARELPACVGQVSSQLLLAKLHKGGKIKADPGPPDGTNNDSTSAAVKEFQKVCGLAVTGLPDSATQRKLVQMVDDHAPSATKQGLNPTVLVLYWLGNEAEPGGSATLRMASMDLKTGQELQIFLKDSVSGKEVEAKVKLVASGAQSEVVVPIPEEFGLGSILLARVKTELEGGKTLEMSSVVPFFVRKPIRQTPATQSADWRPFIGKDSVPDEVLEAIKKNRDKYPKKSLKLVTGKYGGEYHFDYNPPDDHVQWAKSWVQKKVDATSDRVEKMVARTFLKLLDLEGRPASMQTYDSQIVTWGVGLGAKGDGKLAFAQLNKSSGMKKLLDDLGVNFEKGDYHVVHLGKKKVISSSAGEKGNDDRHIQPLNAWREQEDLLSAIIGISEDPATREAVGESQYAVYVSNSTQWPGKDKVFTVALFVMIVHMHHWLPAIAKYGFNAAKEFQAIGGGEPSLETDAKLAERVARAFVRKAKAVWADSKPDLYQDVHDRTRSKLWAELRKEGAAERFDPGALTYDDE